MRTHNIFSVVSVCLLATSWSASSHAVVVKIDSFSASGTNSSGAFSFTDNFSDGTPPPCGPGGCAAQPSFYGVNSTNPLPLESGGFLQLDSTNGVSGTTATGEARLNENVYVGGTKSQLLSSGGDISMTGIFTLPTLSGPLPEGYGIRFVDGAPGGGIANQEVLQLQVQWWTGEGSYSPGWYVRYHVQDFFKGTNTTVGAAPVSIPVGTDEISLSLSRAAGSSFFEATYAYGTGGLSGTFGTATSLGTATGFLYQDYVRPGFYAFEAPVPEPETYALMLAGLGLVGWAVRRKRG